MNVWAQDLHDYFFWQESTSNPKILAAEINQMALNQNWHFAGLVRDNDVLDFATQATSAISVLLDRTGKEKVLFAKNIEETLPIASITKLMTAKVVLENYDLQKEIVITREAVAQEESLGELTAGQTLTVQQLLYPLLMESSNDAAFALFNDYDGMTRVKFVEMMNAAAREMGLANTYFYNPSGLEPEEDRVSNGLNYSTAADLVTLTKNLLDKPLIWDILQTSRINLYGPILANGNKLLDKMPGVLGGKTGYTEQAQGCFVLVVEAPADKGILVNVILGAPDRFLEMENLINWVKQAYGW
jgi:D-alanyl-D-alanine carboxypeptidase